MKKIIDTFKNIFSIEDLRVRIINTVGFLLIFRLGSFVVLPGIDPSQLNVNSSGIFGLLNTFLGGAFSNASIFGLGIMPYISASIVIQLLTVAFPYFQKLQKEGESGRSKLNQFTRVLTILITAGQSFGYIAGTINQEAIIDNSTFFYVSSMITLTAGTMFCMWIGERITEKGIGNGISMLIMIGIVSRFPGAIIAEALLRDVNGILIFLFELIALFIVVMGVVVLTQATRKIPVQYAKQIIGNKVYGGQRQYIPLKLNSAGVMPIIFAQSLMFLPTMIAAIWADQNETAAYIRTIFSDYTSWQYNLVFASLIIIFTFFYTAITINPTQIAEDMKKNNSFVPGVKPGIQTSDFIDDVVTKITLPGALFLAAVATLPTFAKMTGVSAEFSQFYGGTSLLIMVGVILDTLQQIESYLLLKHYEGMMHTDSLKTKTTASNVYVAS